MRPVSLAGGPSGDTQQKLEWLHRALREVERASIENDSVTTAQNFTIGNPPTAQRAMAGSSVQLSATGIGNAADTSEDVLFTFSLPASSLTVVGEGITILAFGKLASNGDNKTVKLYFGAQVYSLGTVATANVSWMAKLTVFRSAANVQVILGEGRIAATPIALSVLSGSETDTGAITIKVTGQSGASTANNITANAMIVAGAVSDVGNMLATLVADFQRGGSYRTT